MLRHSWALLGLLGAGRGTSAPDQSQDKAIAALQTAVEALPAQDQDIKDLKAAVAALQSANNPLVDDLATANAALAALQTVKLRRQRIIG